jgi:hypothetical protein
MMGVVLYKYRKRVQNEQQLCVIQFYNTVVIDNKQLDGGNLYIIICLEMDGLEWFDSYISFDWFDR